MIPDKVVITITGSEYCVEVLGGEEVLSNRKTIMQSAGMGKAEEIGDVYDDLSDDFDDLSETVEDVNLALFSIAGELYILNEED